MADERHPRRRSDGTPSAGGDGGFPDHLFDQADEQFRRLEALAGRAQPDAGAVRALGEQPYAALPCPGCEGVNRFRLDDPPRPQPCRRCGAPIDPTQPVPARLAVLDAVVEGTTAALVVVASSPRHPIAGLTGLMAPALRASHGRFVVVTVDTDEEGPDAAQALGLRGVPAVIFHQGGRRLGAITLPGGLADLASGFQRFLGPLIGGATTGAGLPFPFLGPGGALPGPPGAGSGSG